MLLSIIIPIYNTKPAFIQECLDSISLIQNIDYEVIVVNDGSTNAETCAFLNNLTNTPPLALSHFQLIHKENGGLSSARNTGIRQAQGKFIFPLDSDDKVNPDIVHFIEHLQQHPQTEILYGDHAIFGDKTEHHITGEFYNVDLWLFNNKLTACSIYAKSVWERVGGYDENFPTCEDWDFWCRCASIGAKFSYIPFVNYDYRVINDGNSLFQQTQNLIPKYHQKTLEKLPMSLIEKDELQMVINHNLRKQLRKKRRKAIAILIYAYSPKLFYWLCKKGLFSYKDNFYQI